jgi:hypothetical protein
VITDKDHGRRIDLASLALAGTRTRGPLRLDLELGLAGLGRLGGASLQNGYHRLGGVATVGLEYPDHTRWGLLAAQRLDLELPASGPLAWTAGLHNLDHSTGFHRVRLILATRAGIGDRWTLQAFAGANRYHHLDIRLARAFESGPAWGCAVDCRTLGAWHLGAWLLADSRRGNQGVPGLSLHWQAPGDRRDSWGRILLP